MLLTRSLFYKTIRCRVEKKVGFFDSNLDPFLWPVLTSTTSYKQAFLCSEGHTIVTSQYRLLLRRVLYHWKKEKGPTFSDTNFVVLDSVLFSGILVQMNTGSTDGSQQQSSSSNQSTGGKDATTFSKSGKSYLLFLSLFIHF